MQVSEERLTFRQITDNITNDVVYILTDYSRGSGVIFGG
jgi:hypothetical protein